MNQELVKQGTKDFLWRIGEIVELALQEKLECGMVEDSQGKIEDIVRLFTAWRYEDVLD